MQRTRGRLWATRRLPAARVERGAFLYQLFRSLGMRGNCASRLSVWWPRGLSPREATYVIGTDGRMGWRPLQSRPPLSPAMFLCFGPSISMRDQKVTGAQLFGPGRNRSVPRRHKSAHYGPRRPWGRARSDMVLGGESIYNYICCPKPPPPRRRTSPNPSPTCSNMRLDRGTWRGRRAARCGVMAWAF